METKKIIQKLVISSMLLIVCLCYKPAIAQIAVTTDGTPPDGSSMLDVKSSAKGVLLPRMTQTDIEGITNPANGLIVYNTDDNHFYYFDAGDNFWKEIAIGSGLFPLLLDGCGDAFVDVRDDQSYTTVQIGNQCWMVENLNYEMANGCWWYDNDPAIGADYGRLYNWDAAMIACPDGWHLPSHTEWSTLVDFQGMWVAISLKESGDIHWYSDNGTNSSGFTALPGGCYLGFGSAYGLREWGAWWTTTVAINDLASAQLMKDYSDDVSRIYKPKLVGYSVRCVRDN